MKIIQITITEKPSGKVSTETEVLHEGSRAECEYANNLMAELREVQIKMFKAEQKPEENRDEPEQTRQKHPQAQS